MANVIPSWMLTYVAILNKFDRNQLNCAEAKKALDEADLPAVVRKKGEDHINRNRKTHE